VKFNWEKGIAWKTLHVGGVTPGGATKSFYDQILSKAAINCNDSTWIDISHSR
jgi:hypothetical protein